MRPIKRRKVTRPVPGCVGLIVDRYYHWLWMREQKRRRVLRAHWIGRRSHTIKV